MSPAVVVKQNTTVRSRPAAATRPAPQRYWTVIAVAGFTFMFVAWTDIALLWYPLRLKEVEWEFATVTATVNALPLATMGLVFITVAALAKGSVGLSRVVAALCAGMLLVLIALAGLYTLTLLAGYSAVDPAARPVLIRATAKTSVLVVTYLLFHLWLGWISLRSGRSASIGS